MSIYILKERDRSLPTRISYDQYVQLESSIQSKYQPSIEVDIQKAFVTENDTSLQQTRLHDNDEAESKTGLEL